MLFSAPKRIVTSIILALAFLIAPGSTTSASAAPGWVDCIIVSEAGIPYFSSGKYEVTIKNGCDSDTGSIRLEFDDGDWFQSSWSSTYTSVYSPSRYFGSSSSFDVSYLKPGTYQPSVKLTATKDYSSKTVSLPSFTIQAPNQPGLGSTGGSYVPPITADATSGVTACITGGSSDGCFDGNSWTYEACFPKQKKAPVLQYKEKKKWKKLFKTTFEKTSASCADPAFPTLVSISVTDTEFGTVKYRIVSAKKKTLAKFSVTIQ